jgi:hypothetical protein
VTRCVYDPFWKVQAKNRWNLSSQCILFAFLRFPNRILFLPSFKATVFQNYFFQRSGTQGRTKLFYFIFTVPCVLGSEPTVQLIYLHIQINKSSSSGREGPKNKRFSLVSVFLASSGTLLVHQEGPQGGRQEAVGPAGPQGGRQEAAEGRQEAAGPAGPQGGRQEAAEPAGPQGHRQVAAEPAEGRQEAAGPQGGCQEAAEPAEGRQGRQVHRGAARKRLSRLKAGRRRQGRQVHRGAAGRRLSWLRAGRSTGGRQEAAEPAEGRQEAAGPQGGRQEAAEPTEGRQEAAGPHPQQEPPKLSYE